MSLHDNLQKQLDDIETSLKKKTYILKSYLINPLSIIEKTIKESPLFNKISGKHNEPCKTNYYTAFVGDDVLVYVDFHGISEEDALNDFIRPLLRNLRKGGYNVEDPERIDFSKSYVYYINIHLYSLSIEYPVIPTIRVRCELIDIPDHKIVEEKYTGTRYKLVREE
jgi:hypothetical protein